MQRILRNRVSTIVVIAGTAIAFAAGARLSTPGCAQSAAPVPQSSAPTSAAPVVTRVAAVSPFIDVHTHLERAVAEGSIEIAVHAMQAENSAKYLFLPSPFPEGGKGAFDIELIQSAAKKYPDKIMISGGGGTLNPMIEEAVHAGAVSPELEKRFKDRAEEIARLGAVGFGELAAEHEPSASTPTYQSVPPDHPLFLALTDIAAEHGLPITLHMEAVPEAMPIPAAWHVNPMPNPPQLPANIAAFERLLAHNPRAKIVWAHEGWDNTGFRTVALSRRLLQAHANLFMELKVDPLSPGLNSPLEGGATGKIKPEWLKLFQDFPNRFVIGSDQHYPMPDNGAQRWQAVVLLFNQLPPDLRQKIGLDNVPKIYRLKSK
jgi:predicted TIM-barrel fold metal-dependent hydrolase